MDYKQFGNFLTPEDLDRIRYKRYKYVLRFGVMCLAFILLLGIVGEILAIGYNSIKYQPVNVSKTEYDAAQGLNNELRSRAAYLASTRPNNVNVIAALSAILSAKPDNIKFDNISISMANITITGKSGDMDTINSFVAKIDYPGMKASISNVGSSETINTYKVTISPDAGTKKPKQKEPAE